MSFLNAEWRKLAIANYEVDPQILLKYLPAHTKLDSFNGIHYVSLVGFMFVNTRVLGLRIPMHTNFEEVNLRFYVKHYDGNEWKRGVVFIKEIVPKSAITFIANTLYKEHYETMEMDHLWQNSKHSSVVKYDWKYKNKWNSFFLRADSNKIDIKPGSKEEFITEHYWGYTKVDDNTSYEYQVTHPKWDCYPISEYNINVDFGSLYGKSFESLNNDKPRSVMLAEGSEITVENKTVLK